MTESARSFDVLVIGSGASGLAAAVSAERAGARVALATKGSLQANNSSKAQGGIQAAFGADDSPEQHAQDVWRSSHETADMRLVEVLTGDAQSAIHWLEELGVEFTREDGGYRLARCGGATAKRLLQVGDRTGHAITKQLRDAWEAGSGTSFLNAPLRELHRARRSVAGAGRGADRRRRHRRARRGRPLLRGGRAARRALDQSSERHRRGDADRRRSRRGGARPRCAAVPPERRRVAVEHAGLLDSGDDACVRRRARERRAARSSPIRSARAMRSARRSSTRSKRETA